MMARKGGGGLYSGGMGTNDAVREAREGFEDFADNEEDEMLSTAFRPGGAGSERVPQGKNPL